MPCTGSGSTSDGIHAKQLIVTSCGAGRTIGDTTHRGSIGCSSPIDTDIDHTLLALTATPSTGDWSDNRGLSATIRRRAGFWHLRPVGYILAPAGISPTRTGPSDPHREYVGNLFLSLRAT